MSHRIDLKLIHKSPKYPKVFLGIFGFIFIFLVSVPSALSASEANSTPSLDQSGPSVLGGGSEIYWQGWHCRGNDGKGSIDLTIVHDALTRGVRAGNNKMDINYLDSSSEIAHSIALVDSLETEQRNDTTVYIGGSSLGHRVAILIIDRSGGEISGIPAHLRIQEEDEWGNPSGIIYEDVNLICDPEPSR